MHNVQYHVGHRALSYTQVVLGLGLVCSLCALFGAYLVWHLGALVQSTPQAIGALGWVVFAYQVIGIFVTWVVFSGLVLVLSACIAGWATWFVDRDTPGAVNPWLPAAKPTTPTRAVLVWIFSSKANSAVFCIVAVAIKVANCAYNT